MMTDRLKTMMEKRVRVVWAVVAVLAAGVGGAVLAAGTVTPGNADKAAIEKIVRDYILAHPEIIPEAMTRLQDREVTQLLSSPLSPVPERER